MKASSSIVSLSLLIVSLVTSPGCDQGFVIDNASIKTTYQPPNIEVTEQEGYKIVRGGLKLQNLESSYEKATNRITIKGSIDFVKNDRESLTLDLEGQVDDHGFAILKPRAGTHAVADIKLGGKVTCLGENWDCSSSFMDIYIAHAGHVYHHQIEVQQHKAEGQIPDSGAYQPEDDTDHDAEEGDEADDVTGPYVGDTVRDIEVILEIPRKKLESEQQPERTGPVEPNDDSKDDSNSGPKGDTKEEPKKTTIPNANKKSQAIDQVNKGRLESPISALDYMSAHAPAGFFVLRPQRKTHFATNELMYVIAKIGEFTKKEVPGYILPIGDLSREKGGAFGSHKSHQNGLDADIAYYFEEKKLQFTFNSAVASEKPNQEWMLEKQWKLFKTLNRTKLVDRIFIHKTLKKALCEFAIAKGEIHQEDTQGEAFEILRRLSGDVDHNTHFHLRIKCSSAQVRCRQLPDPAKASGCF